VDLEDLGITTEVKNLFQMFSGFKCSKYWPDRTASIKTPGTIGTTGTAGTI
jgi:hypothetical protein